MQSNRPCEEELDRITGCVQGIEFNYPVIKANSQIRIGPPEDNKGTRLLPRPEKGSEIYVRGLPVRCDHLELFKLFASIGRIYEMRLVVNFSGLYRGYCFVRYDTPHDAARAIEKLNDYRIEDRQLTVCESRDTCTLCLYDIPATESAQDVLNFLTSVPESPPFFNFRFSRGENTAHFDYENHSMYLRACRLIQQQINVIRNRMKVKRTDI